MDEKEYKERVAQMKSINKKFDHVRNGMEFEKKEHDKLKGVYSFMPDNDAENMTYEELKELDTWYKDNHPEQRLEWIAEWDKRKEAMLAAKLGAAAILALGQPKATPYKKPEKINLKWYEKAFLYMGVGVLLPVAVMVTRKR